MTTHLLTLPISINIALFALLALIIWVSGTKLTYLSDTLATRLGISSSMMGLVFLSSTTSLPEVATTLSAAVDGLPDLALNNLFGGVILQTALLAFADLWTRGAISNYPRKANHALEATLLVMILTICLIIFTIGEPIVIWNIGLGSFIVLIAYCASIVILRNYDGANDWVPVDVPTKGLSNFVNQISLDKKDTSTKQLIIIELTLAAIIFVAGILIVTISNVLSIQSDIGTDIMGVIFLAAATSLPELTTTMAAVRIGAYTLAISNIFGSNLIMMGLIFPADVIFQDGPILGQVGDTVQLASILGILVTSIYIVGLIIRRKPRIGSLGLDSVFVLLTYVLSLVLFWYLF